MFRPSDDPVQETSDVTPTHRPPTDDRRDRRLLSSISSPTGTLRARALGRGAEGRICDLHRFNFLLWHEEDIARSPRCHRRADRPGEAGHRPLQPGPQRLRSRRSTTGSSPNWPTAASARPPDVPAATETPGAAIDRLSILELRRFHMREQIERADASPEHREKAAARMAVLDPQRKHLIEAIDRLLGGDLLGPAAAAGVPPDEDVQRSDDESVSLQGRRHGRDAAPSWPRRIRGADRHPLDRSCNPLATGPSLRQAGGERQQGVGGDEVGLALHPAIVGVLPCPVGSLPGDDRRRRVRRASRARRRRHR